jgi:hypothetical protein
MSPPNILLVPEQPITWTRALLRALIVSALSLQGDRPHRQQWRPETSSSHECRSFACKQHGSIRRKSTQASSDTTCGSQKSSRAQSQHHESHTRMSSFAIAAHDLEAGTEPPSVIAMHTRRRQSASLKLHCCTSSRGSSRKPRASAGLARPICKTPSRSFTFLDFTSRSELSLLVTF